MIAVAIGPDSSRPGSQKNLKQIAGEKLIELPYNMSEIGEKMDAVVNYVCGMYLMTFSTYSISALNVPVACLIVNDEEFVKSNSKR